MERATLEGKVAALEEELAAADSRANGAYHKVQNASVREQGLEAEVKRLAGELQG